MLDVEIRVEKSTGYVTAEELKMHDDDIEIFQIDANFSPIVSVQDAVE